MRKYKQSRRNLLRSTGLTIGAVLLANKSIGSTTSSSKPNVLMIAVDDLNDWIGCLGGHPDTRTPNMDRLAARGVLFTNSQCAAPACVPSRTAIFSGYHPTVSGIYENWAGTTAFRQGKILPTAKLMPQHFMENGYRAMGAGKLLHGSDPISWNEYFPSKKQYQPRDPKPPADKIPLNGMHSYSDWGAVDCKTENMGDWKVSGWAIEKLQEKHEKPFFIACGIYRPHEPWYLPQHHFDRFPLDSLTMPVVKADDLDDIPRSKKSKMFLNIQEQDEWRKGVQAYLACINFADECVGRVLDALDASEYKDNTIVLLWSDHGWHLGEKHHWGKFTLWEESARTVLMVSAPGVTKPGQECASPVNLIVLYPTLIDLCGLPPKPELSGTSFVPQLKDPSLIRSKPALTTHGPGNHSLRFNDWRYIRRDDGREELYDHRNDPYEWTNLASNPEYAEKKKELKAHLPQHEEISVWNYEEFPQLLKREKKDEPNKNKAPAKSVDT